MAAPRPRLCVLLLALAAPARSQGLGLSDQLQGPQAGIATGLWGLQDGLAALRSGAASAAGGLAAELSSGTQGLRERLAGLKGRLAEESEYWDGQVRESWRSGLALLTGAQRITRGWGCWECANGSLTSARHWLQEELSLRAEKLQGSLAWARGSLTSALQLNLAVAQVQGSPAQATGDLTPALPLNLTVAAVRGSLASDRLLDEGLSSRLAAKRSWLKGRFEEESAYWNRTAHESWEAVSASWPGTGRGAVKLGQQTLPFARGAIALPREGEAARAHEARIARRFRAWLLEGLAARARPGARPAAGGAQLCGACLADDDEERGAESPRAAQGPGLASACLCCAWLWLLAWRGLGAAWGHAAALGRPAAAARAAQAEFDRAFPSDVRDEAEPDGTRRRVLTIRCPGVQHEDISVESVCNGCAVAIARGGPGGGPGGGCSRLFQWQLSEGLFSLVDELARFEHGGVLHLVLRESPSQGRRAVCLPQLFRLDAGEEGACGDSSGPDEGSEVGEAPSAAGSEVNGDHPESDAAYDEDARSDSSQVSGGDPPSGAASVDGWEKVGACSDGEEGLAEVRPGAWPL